jgi:thioredoxin-related protein
MQNKIKKYIEFLLFLFLFTGMIGSFKANAQEPVWHSFEEALAIADTTDQPVLVDVWAPWCGWCHKMKKDVYPAITPALKNKFVMTRLNRDNHDKVHNYRGQKLTSFELAQQLKAESLPTIVFLASSGKYLLHLSGFREARELRPVLEYIATESYRNQTYQTFLTQRKKISRN